MMFRVLRLCAVLAALGSTSCAMCGACADAIRIDVTVSDEGPVSVSHSQIACTDAGDFWSCTAYALPEGDYSILISAPGHRTEMRTFSIGPPSGGDLYCPGCPDHYSTSVSLTPL